MIYLFWGLLNVVLFLYFIVLCFKATKLIRAKISLLAAFIFVFGLLSFMGNGGSKDDNIEPGTNQIETWEFDLGDSLDLNSTLSLTIDLEKTLISKYFLGIKYAKEKEGKVNIPISAYSSTDGFVSGTLWKPVLITVNRTADNNRFEYIVDGIVEYKLLGATLYWQAKMYKGIALVN